MNLQDRYQNTMNTYHDYFEHVREAFRVHCEEIKQKAVAALEPIPKEDKEARREVLMQQKKELDEALAELKRLVNFQTNKMHQALEEIRREQEAEQFDLEKELASV